MNEGFVEYLIGGERFVSFGGYRFDRLIFAVFTIVSLILFVGVFIYFGSDRSYTVSYSCADFCENPFQNNYPVCESMWAGACEQEFVYGPFDFNQPPWIVKYWGTILGGFLLLSFVVNHLLYNRNFRGHEDI